MMGNMKMALPENTLPMMTGAGQYGSIEMGGMFTVLKIRPGLAKNDYTDPGWYHAPKGTVAYEWKGAPPPNPVKARSSADDHADFRVVDPRRSRQAMHHE